MLTVSGRAGLSPNLELVPPPHHPTTPAFGRHGGDGQMCPGLDLIFALFWGEKCKAPLGEKAGEVPCSADAEHGAS